MKPRVSLQAAKLVYVKQEGPDDVHDLLWTQGFLDGAEKLEAGHCGMKLVGNFVVRLRYVYPVELFVKRSPDLCF